MELGCRSEICIMMWDNLRASPEPAPRDGWQALRKHRRTVFKMGNAIGAVIDIERSGAKGLKLAKRARTVAAAQEATK